ncbi:MAG: cohesin domain-containing protein, partial [Anaerolineae bacterium]|nr:cohesin domain-containing protein [Anaerolineae bacterium]
MRRTIWGMLLSVILLATPLATHGVAAQGNTRVALSPASALVGEGQTAAVEVRVENVQDLYGLDIRISFDPAVVEVVDADATQAGVQVRPGDLLSVDFMIRNTADNAQGTIWYALTQLNPTEPVSGSGTAFIILFKGKQRGATSALTITYQKMATRAGEAIPASVVNGEIRVVEPAQSPPTPTPAPPPPQPTVPMPTPEPTQASPTVQPTATQPMPTATVAPTSTALPVGTAATGQATATSTQPPAPT